jgi:hypothetical protein
MKAKDLKPKTDRKADVARDLHDQTVVRTATLFSDLNDILLRATESSGAKRMTLRDKKVTSFYGQILLSDTVIAPSNIQHVRCCRGSVWVAKVSR